MKQPFQTIKAPTLEVVFRDRGSKFYGCLFPSVSSEQAQEQINQLKEKYPNATHHCYAYRLGSTGEQYRAYDDGEPSGTAGLPIYNQLQSAELTNVLAIVVRFYGGTKLGSSGLVHAYKEATKLAIAEAKIITETPKLLGEITFPYALERAVKAMISRYNCEIVEQTFTANCNWVVNIPLDKEEEWINATREMKTLTFKIINN